MKNYHSHRFFIPAKHLQQADQAGVLQAEMLVHKSAGDTVALLFHPNPVDGGNMDNKVIATLLRFCRDQGMDVLRYNSRGVGDSSGTAKACLEDELMDALAVVDWLKSNTQAHRLWLGGFSFGGAVACHVAHYLSQQVTGFEIDALALIAPSIERHSVGQLHVPWARTLLVYGDRDQLIMPASLANFAKRHGLANVVLAGAGHLFHGQLPKLKQALEILYLQIKKNSKDNA